MALDGLSEVFWIAVNKVTGSGSKVLIRSAQVAKEHVKSALRLGDTAERLRLARMREFHTHDTQLRLDESDKEARGWHASVIFKNVSASKLGFLRSGHQSILSLDDDHHIHIHIHFLCFDPGTYNHMGVCPKTLTPQIFILYHHFSKHIRKVLYL